MRIDGLEQEPADPIIINTSDASAVIKPWRRALSIAANLTAIIILLVILAAPNELNGLSWRSFARLPIEFVVIIGLALVIPQRWRTVCAVVVGLILASFAVLKLADMGFYAAFGRTSNPASDWAYFRSAVDLLSVSIGRSAAIVTLIGGAVLLIGLILVSPWAVRRIFTVVGQYRQAAIKSWVLITVGWVVLALFGAGPASSIQLASAESTRMLADHGRELVQWVGDERNFSQSVANDSLRQIPDDQLLEGLRGKDVIVAFVESYGRVALEAPGISTGVAAILDDGTRKLADAGFSSRSSWLTSPTFGGISWLAHATLQSGLWVNSQQRYDQLLQTNRATLSAAFNRAGWRTVGDAPSNGESWPEGKRFYQFDAVYDAYNVGYRGPRFGYATMPDQYVLDAFRRLELAPKNRPRVMAEIDLVSSHTPWTPLPRLVPWSEIGDGSVFNVMSGEGPSQDILWRDPSAVQAAYGHSIEYSLSALISFVEYLDDPELVLIILGDHQPAMIVSGTSSGNDVPITIIAHDPKVLARLDGWKWQVGTRPSLDAPVTGMDTFRDSFIAAFSAKTSAP